MMSPTKSDIENDYATDEVSLTSTQPDEEGEDKPYDVEDIIADARWAGEDEMHYLIKWAGYPLEECTWEPEHHLEGSDLLSNWEAKRIQMGEQEFERFKQKNSAAYEHAFELKEYRTEQRRQKRQKRRQKIFSLGKKRPTPVPGLSSDSEDEPLCARSRRRASVQESSFVKERNLRRKPPFEESSSSDSPGTARQGKYQTRAKASSSKPKKKEQPNTSAELEPQILANDDRRNSRTLVSTGNSSKPKRTAQNVSLASTKAIKTPGAIKLFNEPNFKTREWQNSEGLYKTLKFRRNAEKRSAIEGPPDPAQLSWVGAAPLGIARRISDNNDRRSTDEDVFGRSNSKQMQDRNMSEEEAAAETSKLKEWEKTKPPLSCFDWRNSQCRYAAENCRFLHRSHDPSTGRQYDIAPLNNKLAPKYLPQPQTCLFWFRGDTGCSKPDDECLYAHHNTGVMAHLDGSIENIDPTGIPHSQRKRSDKTLTCLFWLRCIAGCTNSASQCKYAHENTGFLAKVRDKRPERIALSEQPLSTCPRHLLPRATCPFWLGGTCRKSTEDCQLAHENTGRMWSPDGRFLLHIEASEHLNKETANNNKVICTHWLRGKCHFGVNCRKAHTSIDSTNQPVSPQRTQDIDTYSLNDSTDQLFSPRRSSHTGVSHDFASKLLCPHLKAEIEATFKLDFAEIFSSSTEACFDSMLDRKAFLCYHPEDHAEELELLTRWLLMHHVEVYSFWFDGAWDSFQSHIRKGGAGVVFVHPDFEYFSTIPHFGQVLRENVHLMAVGLQEGSEYRYTTQPPKYRVDTVTIFPHGGFIYITDEVFVQNPQLALKIMQLFFAKIETLRKLDGPIDPWNRVTDACLLWRLCVRPGLMQFLFNKCIEHEAEVDAGNPFHTSWAEMYKLFHETRYIEQDAQEIYHPRKEDYWPVMSEHERFSPEKEGIKGENATTQMIQYYAGLLIDMRREYRHFFVVHTQPDAPCAEGWKDDIQNLDSVITPEKLIELLQAPPSRNNPIDFLDWALTPLPDSFEQAESPDADAILQNILQAMPGLMGEEETHS